MLGLELLGTRYRLNFCAGRSSSKSVESNRQMILRHVGQMIVGGRTLALNSVFKF